MTMEHGETNPSTLAFFDACYDTFQESAHRAGALIEQYYRVGRHKIRLCFAGPALVPHVTPALAHLAEPPGAKSSLTVCLFDSFSTRTSMPPAPWDASAYGKQGEVMGFNTDRIRVNYVPGVYILQMLDRQRNLAIYWVMRPEIIPWWEKTFPFRFLLHWWMENRSLQPIHAGAVGTPEAGVLIVGKSGSGKSTTTLACLSSDLAYAGDDYVLAEVAPTPFVYSLYGTAKLEADNLHRLPHLRRFVSNADTMEEEKAVFFLNESHPHKLSRGFPIAAILVPRLTGARNTRLSLSKPGAALMAIAGTTLFHLQGARREGFQKIAELVNRVPCYTLELGTDLAQIPPVISDLLMKGTGRCQTGTRLSA
jgi:hypothetical protein